MTIVDYIRSKFQLWSVNYESVETELQVVGLNSEDEMTEAVNLDAYYYRVIPDILLLPNSVSEGGFSISYDKNSLTAYYNMVAKRLGKPNLLSTNTITDITHKW